MKHSRVLISYHFGPKAIPLGEQLSRAFERSGMEVYRFDSGVPRSPWDLPRRLIKSLSKLIGQKKKLARYWEQENEKATARRFKEAALQFRPDLMLIIRGEPVDAEVVSELKQMLGARVVLWWVKTMRWQSLMERDGRVFDAIFTIHPRLATDQILHLPAFALDRERYFPPAERENQWPLLFVGCWSERRQKYLEEIADLPLAIIGPNWRKRLGNSHPLQKRIVTDWVADHALADCYRKAAIVIDIAQIERQVDEGETMRLADVPACGAVLVTELSCGVEGYFQPNSIVLFDSPLQLRIALEALLSNPGKMAEIAANATVDVQKLPIFEDRVRLIVEKIEFSAQKT